MAKRFLVLLIVLISSGISIYAQTDTLILFETENTSLQTGQYYTIQVSIRDVSEIWQANVEIAYDPKLLYIVGTQSGSPVKVADFLPADQSIIIRNAVNSAQINYTQSLIAPAVPLSGSGTLASFQVYPLSAGTTQLSFRKADLTKVIYTENADGSRTLEDTKQLPVLPVLLELSISGDTVEPPSEATATPQATATIDPARIQNNFDSTEEATLVNVTLAPSPAPTLGLIPDLVTEDSGSSNGILPVAIGLVFIGALGVIVMLVLYFRRS